MIHNLFSLYTYQNIFEIFYGVNNVNDNLQISTISTRTLTYISLRFPALTLDSIATLAGRLKSSLRARARSFSLAAKTKVKFIQIYRTTQCKRYTRRGRYVRTPHLTNGEFTRP